MPADDDLLDSLADAILDGTPIDWAAMERQSSGGGQSVIDRLKVLAALADVHRCPSHVSLQQGDQPERWGHLRVMELVGRGAFGRVYRAHDTRLDRDVALKLLPVNWTSGGTRANSIIDEGRRLAQIRHLNVVTIHGAERIGDEVGLWMELVEGRTLEELLEDGRHFAVSEVVDIGLQLCGAVSAVHQAGFLHRDIKSHNVMLADDGRVVLMDFGTGWEIKSNSEAAPAGTPLYLAPELIEGTSPTIQSDIYALGVLLFHLLTGVYPISAEGIDELRRAHQRKDRLDLQQLRAEVPRHLARVIETAIDPRPQRRYASGAAMATDLRAPTRVSKSSWTALLTLALVVAVLISVPALRRATGGAVSREGATVTITPVTSTPGTKSHPVLSPDGSRVAFSWWDASGESEIYIKDLASGVTTQVTRTKGGENYPGWSPDGRFLAFYRRFRNDADKPNATIRVVPADGGPERSLWEGEGGLLGRGLDWSPDGRHLLLSMRTSLGEPLRLLLLDVVSLKQTLLTTPPPGSVGDARAVFSPDGKSLAFVRSIGSEGTLQILQLANAALTHLPIGTHDVRSITWTADGQTLIFTSHGGGARDRLWRISRRGGEAEPIPGIGEGASLPSVARHSGRTVFLQQVLDSNLYRAELSVEGGTGVRQLASSTRADAAPDISPDGSRIAFASNRTGSFEIWLVDADGGRPTQLSGLRNLAHHPRWSPDGRRIVFSARPSTADLLNLYVVNVSTGATNRITWGSSRDQFPTWSADGTSVYFASDRSGMWQVWKTPAAGGEPVQVTRDGGIKAWESNDGRSLYYADTTRGIWQMPADGGQPTLILQQPEGTAWGGEWIPTPEGIYWRKVSVPRDTIELFTFATRQSVPAILPAGELEGGSGFSVSKDRRWVVFSQRDYHGSDIMMVEGLDGSASSNRAKR